MVADLKTGLVNARTTVTQMKCACGSYLYVVVLDEAVQKNGKHHHSDTFANAHPAGQGSGHQGCEGH